MDKCFSRQKCSTNFNCLLNCRWSSSVSWMSAYASMVWQSLWSCFSSLDRWLIIQDVCRILAALQQDISDTIPLIFLLKFIIYSLIDQAQLQEENEDLLLSQHQQNHLLTVPLACEAKAKGSRGRLLGGLRVLVVMQRKKWGRLQWEHSPLPRPGICMWVEWEFCPQWHWRIRVFCCRQFVTNSFFYSSSSAQQEILLWRSKPVCPPTVWTSHFH